MATYLEIRGLFANTDLRNRVEVACIVAAEAIRVEDAGTTNHTNRLIWMQAAFANPRTAAEAMLKSLLAANKSATVANIIGATDEAIQTQVDAAVDVFADGS